MKLLSGMIIFLILSFSLFPQEFITEDSRVIIILGDTQRTGLWEFWRERNNGIAKKIMSRIADEKPEFVIHSGDMVFDGSSEYAWSCFETDAAELLESKIPLYPVPGNHEYFGSNKKALINLWAHFPFLKSSSWYSHRLNSTGIIFLNSNFDDLSDRDNQRQLRWYKNELRRFESDPSIKALIVICHHPPYTNGKLLKGSRKVQTDFADPFLKSSKSAFFFSGHIHSYEHFLKDGRHFIVSGGGGGPRREVEIKEGKAVYKDQFNGLPLRKFHFCRLTLNEKEIKMEAVGLDEDRENFSVMDTFTFEIKNNVQTGSK